MDNQDISRQLDELKMLITNQVDTLTQAYQNADSGKIIAMAAMALKNGKITHQQYETIFNAVNF